MRNLLSILLVLFFVSSLTAQEKQLLARFEVTKGAFDDVTMAPPKLALLLYTKGQNIEGERFDHGESKSMGFGTFESIRLISQLESLVLPKIDYQKYFDALEKKPAKKGQERVIVVDGQEVEVELHIKETIVKFKMWNTDAFFFNHSDDKIVAAVKTAVDAIVLELGKPLVFF